MNEILFWLSIGVLCVPGLGCAGVLLCRPARIGLWPGWSGGGRGGKRARSGVEPSGGGRMCRDG